MLLFGMSEPKLPSPEEIQKRLSEMFQATFGEKQSVVSQPSGQSESSSGGGNRGPHPLLSKFRHTPRDIKEYLDRFVIRQEEAKRVLSVAVCDHYHHAREAVNGESFLEYTKQNILLIGPTGVGKTHLIRHVANLIGVPFVKADATKFSETGYVGGDVDDLVRELVERAKGDISLAEVGIVFLDEIDKIATSSRNPGRDVSGRGVQTGLLKLMEETEVSLKNPSDIQSQIQSVIEMQTQRGRGSVHRETINTRHILFIVSGAFEGLDRIIHHRKKQSQVGFCTNIAICVSENNVLQAANTQDFMEYGFESEFIGRLPVRSICHLLEVEDLFQIMRYSEDSIIRQYERAFHSYGIEVHFEEEALRKIAASAFQEGTGARGLLTVLERLLRDFKYELPDSGVTSFTVDPALVKEPHAYLTCLLKHGSAEKERTLIIAARQFMQQFSEQHKVQVEASESALIRLAQQAIRERITMCELCEKLFKDYQFGLHLIQKGKLESTKLVLPEEAIDNPEEYLSKLVAQSYHNGESLQKDVGPVR
jgi:endopeptidase Clp ATP-binding regulatory subunit ClpX